MVTVGGGARRLVRSAGVAGVTAIAVFGGTSSQARPITKQPLVVDTSFVLEGLDPETYHTPTQLIADKAMYDTLLTTVNGGPPVPSLASKWSPSKNAETFSFTLRKNVRFANGTPLTSADVVFSFGRVAHLGVANSGLLNGITVTAKGRYGVLLTSSTPDPALPEILTTPPLAIVNSALVKQNGGTDSTSAATTDHAVGFFNTESAGSGPYVLSSYIPNSQVTLTANPFYWGPKPTFKTVVIRNMLAPVQLLNVQRGTDEVAIDLSNQQASTLKHDRNLTVHIGPSPNIFFIGMNMSSTASPVAANPHIQQAIRLGINYASLLQIAGPGSVRSAGLIPSGVLGALPASAATKTNIAKAKADVAASRISHPSMTLTYPSGLTINGVDFATVAQSVQASLATIGITISLQALPVVTFLTQASAGKLDLLGVYTTINYPDPSSILKFLPGPAATNAQASDVNWTTGADPTIENLATRASSTLNRSQRGKLFQQVGRLLDTSGPWVSFFQSAQAVVGSSNLTNLALNPAWTFNVAAVGSK